MTLAERFWDKVDQSGDCWEWIGARDTRGYGRILDRRAFRSAHRVSWELTHGDIPAGMFVCHTCDNPPCVRPDHLWLGTNRDNQRDAVHKGRNRVTSGDLNSHAVLTAAEVVVIRERALRGDLHRVIAADYGVTRSEISHIVEGNRWKTVA